MAEHHYIVCQRDSVWQFSFRGHIVAPFTTRKEAVDEAIKAASNDEDRDVEVIVQDHDMQQDIVWQNPKRNPGQRTRK